MTQIGNVPEINSVKMHLDTLVECGLIAEWELPYENILTRLTAAIFFITPINQTSMEIVWEELKVHKMLKYTLNNNKSLSKLEWRVEFNEGFEA